MATKLGSRLQSANSIGEISELLLAAARRLLCPGPMGRMPGMRNPTPAAHFSFSTAKTAAVVFLAGLLALGSAAGAQAAADSLSEEQQTWLRQAQRHEKAGWIYLHIEGGPRARGFQHGYLRI